MASDKVPFLRKIPDAYVAFVFLISGFILPKVWYPLGLVVGVEGTRRPEEDYYWLYVHIAECGFFNRAGISEQTWEGVSGHTLYRGYWLPGLLQAILPALIAVVLLAVRAGWPRLLQRARGKSLLLMLALTFVWLGVLVNAARWWARHVAYEHGNTAGVVFAMAFGSALGLALLVNLQGRTQPLPRLWAYWFRLCAMWMFVYLAWMGVALWLQKTLPFLGYICTTVGALTLWVCAHRNMRAPTQYRWERLVKSEVDGEP